MQVLQHMLQGTTSVVKLDIPAVTLCTVRAYTQLACRVCYFARIETDSSYVHGTDLHELRYLLADLWVEHSANTRC